MSKLGQVQNKCKVITITKEAMDQTTNKYSEKAKEVARAHPGALLWSSLPCTAGCPWWDVRELLTIL